MLRQYRVRTASRLPRAARSIVGFVIDMVMVALFIIGTALLLSVVMDGVQWVAQWLSE